MKRTQHTRAEWFSSIQSTREQLGELLAREEPPGHEQLTGHSRQLTGVVQPHQGVTPEAEAALCNAFAAPSLPEVQVCVFMRHSRWIGAPRRRPQPAPLTTVAQRNAK